MLKGGSDKAGACAHGIQNSLTTRWLITASTPAKISIPCTETMQDEMKYKFYGTKKTKMVILELITEMKSLNSV